MTLRLPPREPGPECIQQTCMSLCEGWEGLRQRGMSLVMVCVRKVPREIWRAWSLRGVRPVMVGLFFGVISWSVGGKVWHRRRRPAIKVGGGVNISVLPLGSSLNESGPEGHTCIQKMNHALHILLDFTRTKHFQLDFAAY